mgnify:CR=1 FL=1
MAGTTTSALSRAPRQPNARKSIHHEGELTSVNDNVLMLRPAKRGLLSDLRPHVDRKDKQGERDRCDQVLVDRLKHWTLRFWHALSIGLAGKGTVNVALAAIVLTLSAPAAEAAGSLQGLLGEMRARYGASCCKVISAFRPGAKVFGTNYPSCHATNQALDMHLSAAAKAHVLRTRFGVIQYRSGHWHVSSCSRELGIRSFK